MLSDRKQSVGSLFRFKPPLDDEIGAENVEIMSDFTGVSAPAYPVQLIHLFSSGANEAVVQVALKDTAQAAESIASIF